jgi:hypothetical protein
MNAMFSAHPGPWESPPVQDSGGEDYSDTRTRLASWPDEEDAAMMITGVPMNRDWPANPGILVGGACRPRQDVPLLGVGDKVGSSSVEWFGKG